MQEITAYQPELFVVYTGHNEFLENRTYAEMKEESPFIVRTKTYLNRLRTYALLRRVWLNIQDRAIDQAREKYEMTGEVKAILDQSFGLNWYHRDQAQERVILKHYRANLERMIAMAEYHHVNIIFVVPPANEKDFSPFKSEYFHDLDKNQRRLWEEYYQTGLMRLEADQYALSLKAFKAAAEIDSGRADLKYRMGQCWYGLGSYGAAKEAFVQAKDLDVAPLRSSSRIQQIVREVGRLRGIPIFDLVQNLEVRNKEQLGHTILGGETFLDHDHPTIKIHQLIAEEITKLMIGEDLIKPQNDWANIPRNALYDSVMASVDNSYFGMRDLNLAKVLDWAGKMDEAAPFMIKAAHTLPHHPEAQYGLGLVYQRRKEYDLAMGAFRRVIEIDSTYAMAYNSLGRIYEMQDDLDSARILLEAAVKYQPLFDDAYFNLGGILSKQGQIPAAIAAYRQALAINPKHLHALHDIGVSYMEEGTYGDAVSAFEQVLGLEPTYFKAYNNLGMIYIQQKDSARAEQMFHRALEINPRDDYSLYWISRLEH